MLLVSQEWYYGAGNHVDYDLKKQTKDYVMGKNKIIKQTSCSYISIVWLFTKYLHYLSLFTYLSV